MATALSSLPMDTDDIPFESFSPPRDASDPFAPTRKRQIPTFNPVPLDPFDTASTSQQKIRRDRRSGVKGEVTEIISIFYACIQVGKIRRAGVVLRRLMEKLDSGIDQQITLHTQFLRASVEHLIYSPSESARQAIHQWFARDIQQKGIPHDVDMIAYMLKASLQSPDDTQGGNRQRLVRRYMNMVDDQTSLQILDPENRGILTAEEVNQIAHICPAYNLVANVDESFEADIIEDGQGFQDQVQVDEKKDESLPHVRAVKQRGLGLKTLRKSLSLFSFYEDRGRDMSAMSPEEKREIQAQLEEDAVGSAIERWREENTSLKKMGLDSSLQTKSLGARMWKWQTALDQHLKEEIAKIDEAEDETKAYKTAEEAERCLYGPFLRLLPTDKLAAVTILSVMSSLGLYGADKGLMLSQGIMLLAGAVEDESIFETIQRSKRRGVWSKNSSEDLRFESFKKLVRARGSGSAAKMIDNAQIGDIKVAWKPWPGALKAKVGAVLMSSLIEVAKVPVSIENAQTKQVVTQLQPALSHSFKFRLGKRYGVVIANKALIQSLKREPVHSLLAKHLPMLVEPEPWTMFNKGGYVVHPSKLVRVKMGDKEQRFYAEAALGQGDMAELCKGLDVLGRTPWAINRPLLEVMLEAWNSGEAVANIPPESPKLEVPPEPESSRDPLERRRWLREVKGVENTRSGLHSQRCFQNFQLEIARALRNEKFYFPHNVDFRGRAYPIPPYFNHMGADHCRSLLKFGKGKELGATGLKWLKVHLANVFGFDKASLSERANFADKHVADIYDSAMNPLKGARWWLKAEDPWQCLAACMEIRNALESPDPTHFVSSLPIHQDGTCNGLQHYAALGGDEWGAKQVNLEPGERPSDVYRAVADLVAEAIAADNKNGHPMAALLDGKVTRKVVKQTVMTNVYGVTFVGAKEQVQKQLVALYPDLHSSKDSSSSQLAAYIARHIFEALGTMFGGAQKIQYWFGECAARIAKCLTVDQIDRLAGKWPHLKAKTARNITRKYSDNLEEVLQFRSTVIWTTPLQMPVVQPYRSAKTRMVTTALQRVTLMEPHQTHAVNKRKQLQAFPPNFIHSLDATHMLISALKCDELGLAFAAVHDSFWTHASDIGVMNGVLRDAFIKIHSEDVIGRLAAEFEARHRNSIYLRLIPGSSLVGRKIQEWRKENNHSCKGTSLFSKTPRLEELLLERKRMQLLQSSDPLEVEAGKKMVTPATIFEEFSSTECLDRDPDLAAVGLGEIPQTRATGHRVKCEEASGLGMQNKESKDDAEMTEGDGKDFEELSFFEKQLQVNRKKTVKTIPLWLPLTFPPVPEKGSFDVSRLKESQYFFS